MLKVLLIKFITLTRHIIRTSNFQSTPDRSGKPGSAGRRRGLVTDSGTMPGEKEDAARTKNKNTKGRTMHPVLYPISIKQSSVRRTVTMRMGISLR